MPKKLTYPFVKDEFEKEGCTLLTTKYTNAFSTLDYLCPYGHKHTTCWNTWQQGCRCPTCSNINKLASGNPNWRGGKTFEDYCSIWRDIEFKKDIRERDGNRCLNPYCNSKNPNDLTIHHIDYNKKNCHPSNLITVCRSCNAGANKDRKWHSSWYKSIIINRYGSLLYV